MIIPSASFAFAAYQAGEYGDHVIIHADCRTVLPKIPDKAIDLVLTDPPSGIDYDASHSKYKDGIVRQNIIGDNAAFDPTPMLKYSRLILWGGNCFANQLPKSKQWLTWVNTMRDDANIRQSDTEIAWTRNCIGRSRVFHHLWIGAYKESESGQRAQHPTQKPVLLMEWCLRLVDDAKTILDPFLGSGTTLVAAKNLGRRAIGVEIEYKYCQIAEQRLAQEVLDLPVGVSR